MEVRKNDRKSNRKGEQMKKEQIFRFVENQAEAIVRLASEINALKSIIGELETRIQSSEQMEATLQAQINGLRERYECLDIQNQTLAKIVDKRFEKISEAATSKLNLVTKNLEPR